MKPPDFKYVRVDSLEEAKQALSVATDDDAKVLAGGQSLVPLMNFRLARPRMLVDINHIPDQAYHRVENDHVELGPLCRHRDVELDQAIMVRCAAIREAVPHIGHVAVRQRGTVVGSFAHGDPLAEWSTLGVLLNAVVRVEREGGSREVPASTWFKGFFDTDLDRDEVATSVGFDLPEGSPLTGSAFSEVSRRHGDFCLASAAAVVQLDEAGDISAVRLVVSGLKTVPWSLGSRASEYRGQAPTEALWTRLAGELPGEKEITSDLHASGATRRAMAHALARRVLFMAAMRAEKRRKDPDNGR